MIETNHRLDTINQLTSIQTTDLASIVERINTIISNKEISEDCLRSITNIIKELEAFREYFTIRIIHSLKRKS